MVCVKYEHEQLKQQIPVFHNSPYIFEALDSYKFGTWCPVSAHKITGPLSFEAINSDCYVHFNLTHLILDFAKGEEVYGDFMQDSALAHAANFSLAVPEGM